MLLKLKKKNLTCRVLALTPGLSSLAKSPDISRLVPNCLVAASSLDAMLTLGDRYDASILYSLPIAPSIAQPTCRPKPIRTPKPGSLSWTSERAVSSRRRAERRRAAWMVRKEARAWSARRRACGVGFLDFFFFFLGGGGGEILRF